MTKIILSGCSGKMGVAVSAVIKERDDCEIVAGVDLAQGSSCDFPVYDTICRVREPADVIIDFSHPSALENIIKFLGGNPAVSAVLCTTGYSEEQVGLIKEASKSSGIFYSRNMSLGVNLLIELAKKAASVLGDSFDVEIIEKHHNQKIDAPSGTALMIADAIKGVRNDDCGYVYDRHLIREKRSKNEIGIHSVRGGSIVGEHEVIFAGFRETLSITHTAESKELFAAGAVNAAVFMEGKLPGLYDMSSLLG